MRNEYGETHSPPRYSTCFPRALQLLGMQTDVCQGGADPPDRAGTSMVGSAANHRAREKEHRKNASPQRPFSDKCPVDHSSGHGRPRQSTSFRELLPDTPNTHTHTPRGDLVRVVATSCVAGILWVLASLCVAALRPSLALQRPGGFSIACACVDPLGRRDRSGGRGASRRISSEPQCTQGCRPPPSQDARMGRADRSGRCSAQFPSLTPPRPWRRPASAAVRVLFPLFSRFSVGLCTASSGDCATPSRRFRRPEEGTVRIGRAYPG